LYARKADFVCFPGLQIVQMFEEVDRPYAEFIFSSCKTTAAITPPTRNHSGMTEDYSFAVEFRLRNHSGAQHRVAVIRLL